MTADEVREVWEWVNVRLAEPYDGIAQGKWTARLPCHPFTQIGFDTEEAAWSKVGAWTKEILQIIADVDEEIAELREQHGYYARWAETCDPDDLQLVTNNRRLRDLYRRVLRSRQIDRAKLRRGMKPQQSKESR